MIGKQGVRRVKISAVKLKNERQKKWGFQGKDSGSRVIGGHSRGVKEKSEKEMDG